VGDFLVYSLAVAPAAVNFVVLLIVEVL